MRALNTFPSDGAFDDRSPPAVDSVRDWPATPILLPGVAGIPISGRGGPALGLAKLSGYRPFTLKSSSTAGETPALFIPAHRQLPLTRRGANGATIGEGA